MSNRAGAVWHHRIRKPPFSPVLSSLRASSPARSSGRDGKRKESLQLLFWNWNSTSNSPVAPRWLSCQISVNQREAETSANVNNHWKTRAKGNDVIAYVISANQHFASTISMQIFEFQRNSCKLVLSFLFPPPPPERPVEFARRPSSHEKQ